MKINWITLKVHNLEASKKFYGEFLSMNIDREFTLPNGVRFAFFASENGTQIEFIEGTSVLETGLAHPGISIGVAVKNYDELLVASREQKILTQEPAVLGGRMECFFVHDPDGMSIQIIKET